MSRAAADTGTQLNSEDESPALKAQSSAVLPHAKDSGGPTSTSVHGGAFCIHLAILGIVSEVAYILSKVIHSSLNTVDLVSYGIL